MEKPSGPVPGRVLVRFRADPELLHERVVVARYADGSVDLVDPERKVRHARLEVGDKYSEIVEWPLSYGTRLPGKWRMKDTYLSKPSDQGDFRGDELADLVKERVRAGAVAAAGGVRRRLTSKSPAPPPAAGVVPRDPGVPVAAKAADPGGGAAAIAYLYVLPEEVHAVGEQVEVPKGATRAVSGSHVTWTWSTGGELVIAAEVAEVDAPSKQEELVRRMVAPGSATAKVGEKAGKDAGSGEGDARALPVTFDHMEERWRTLEDAVAEWEEEEFEDFPIAGPRTIGRDARQLRRQHLDFLKQHDEWARKSGVKLADRSVHEHQAIARALRYLVCYDQLQACNLACAESLNRRRVLIEVAHAGHPESPNYEGAEEYLGVTESGDGTIIDPALTSHVAARQSAKAEVWRKSRIMREEKEAAKKAAALKTKTSGSAP